MKKFTLQIKLGNDAMQNQSDVAGALESVIENLRNGHEDGVIYDNNGNFVGEFAGEFATNED